MRVPAALAVLACLALPAAAAPGEVQDLAWCAGSKTCLSWSSVPAATSYTVYRGVPAGLPALDDAAIDSTYARVTSAVTTGETLTGSPAAGSFFWYLVTASNASGEGTAGFGTGGVRVVNGSGTSCGDLALLEPFSLPDASAWPAPWIPIGSVAEASIVSGMARMQPTVSFYSLGRMHAPLLPSGDANVEVTLALTFEDVDRQGVGFYVRQNGGYLTQSSPHGRGYAVFVEGFRGDGIGVWKEEDGSEISLEILFDPGLDLQNGVRYRVRFAVTQVGPATTRLQARTWREGNVEPSAWQVEFDDPTPVLQGIAGGLAVDSWSSITPGTPGSPPVLHTLVDDVRVERLCVPYVVASVIAKSANR